jgi:hypothetical protein
LVAAAAALLVIRVAVGEILLAFYWSVGDVTLRLSKHLDWLPLLLLLLSAFIISIFS